jgi:hypothetical protein
MIIDMTLAFAKFYNHLSVNDQNKIDDFIEICEKDGLSNLPGRFKNSNDVDKNDRQFLEKTAFANKHHLYHYHIGIPKYNSNSFGQKTSQFILHLQKISNDEYVILSMTEHPPFVLPDLSLLKTVN